MVCAGGVAGEDLAPESRMPPTLLEIIASVGKCSSVWCMVPRARVHTRHGGGELCNHILPDTNGSGYLTYFACIIGTRQ